MKKFLVALIALFLAAPAYGAELQQYQAGPRLIDGTQLNAMVDVVNGLTANGTVSKMKVGETALDASNPTPVATGLTTITSCTTNIKRTTTPGVDTSIITYSTSAGTLNLYGWKVTSSVNNTLIASTGTDTIGWICVGN